MPMTKTPQISVDGDVLKYILTEGKQYLIDTTGISKISDQDVYRKALENFATLVKNGSNVSFKKIGGKLHYTIAGLSAWYPVEIK